MLAFAHTTACPRDVLFLPLLKMAFLEYPMRPPLSLFDLFLSLPGSTLPSVFVLWIMREMPRQVIDREARSRVVTFVRERSSSKHHPQPWTTATTSTNQVRSIVARTSKDPFGCRSNDSGWANQSSHVCELILCRPPEQAPHDMQPLSLDFPSFWRLELCAACLPGLSLWVCQWPRGGWGVDPGWKWHPAQEARSILLHFPEWWSEPVEPLIPRFVPSFIISERSSVAPRQCKYT